MPLPAANASWRRGKKTDGNATAQYESECTRNEQGQKCEERNGVQYVICRKKRWQRGTTLVRVFAPARSRRVSVSHLKSGILVICVHINVWGWIAGLGSRVRSRVRVRLGGSEVQSARG